MGSFSAEGEKACFTSSYRGAGTKSGKLLGSCWEPAGNLLASFFSVVRGLVVCLFLARLARVDLAPSVARVWGVQEKLGTWDSSLVGASHTYVAYPPNSTS
jgi:hypothetical protein